MATQKNNPLGNDWVPPAQPFGNSPEPIALVVEDIPETGGPTPPAPPPSAPIGWNQTSPAIFGRWAFAQDGYAGTYTEP